MNSETQRSKLRSTGISDPEMKIWEKVNLTAGEEFKEDTLNMSAIIFVVEGNVTFKIENLEDCVVQQKKALLIPLGYSFKAKILEDSLLMICRFPVEILLFPSGFLKDIIPLSSSSENAVNSLIINDITSNFLSFVNETILAKFVENSFFELTRKELFILLFSTYSKPDLAIFFSAIIGDDRYFKKIVLENFLKVKNIKELSASAHLSVSGFRKRFKRCFNESPIKWIARKKAEAIRTDILEGSLTLKEISYKYNFTSYGRFYDFCKNQFDVSPSKIESLKE